MQLDPITPRGIKSQQLKEKILLTVMQLIQEYGYEYVTVKNVCTAADISTGSFYHHFENKDELISYYFIAKYARYEAQFNEVTGDDIIKTVIRFYQLHIRYCMEQGLAFIEGFYTTENKNLRVDKSGDRSIHAPIITRTADAIEKAVLAGQLLEEINPLQLSRDLCILFKGCIFEWCVSDGELDLPDISRNMIRNYLLGIATDKYRTAFLKNI